ncbi:unnamed protein product [Microthlaspi erraticum]|uniref:DUF4283 domain-containing protein n=1 Tax=Microthlaspi erraticum TaxID=1685480 RepID=A0A6D2J901_9BRAS|nr:unnamed protein product [Microthlaspi erraticum]CAA7037058.1 unnamed protein product [Microthlaspi erraticum]
MLSFRQAALRSGSTTAITISPTLRSSHTLRPLMRTDTFILNPLALGTYSQIHMLQSPRHKWFPSSSTYLDWKDVPSGGTKHGCGVPVHFWNNPTFTEISEALGTVTNIEARKARFQVSINAYAPLQFERKSGLFKWRYRERQADLQRFTKILLHLEEDLRRPRENRYNTTQNQTWRPKQKEETRYRQLDTPNSRVSDKNRGSVDTRAYCQRTVTDIPNNKVEIGTKANDLLITYPRDTEPETIGKTKGKALAVELSKSEKLQQFLQQNPQPGNLTIREQSNPIVPPVSKSFDSPNTEQNPIEKNIAVTPIADDLMEEPEEGELTQAEINNMINELADSVLDEKMLENDDLLGEELGEEMGSDDDLIETLS